MIERSGKSLAARYRGSRAIGKVLRGARLIWQRVSGAWTDFWLRDQSWRGDDLW